ncbi:MAG: hypothetical protein IJO01_06775 [Oscillospiraceae bacterium]|nr:hypothetical protein [Oscillospiraceae bacterium]
MYLLDVAMGPMYAVMGGMLLLVLGVIAAIVFIAYKLIKKALEKNGDK